MYLEHLTLHGFKSFAHKTILDFKPAVKNGTAGIVAVVGPNGSGKSNVVDAIRWVLGEQSVKQLRGKKSGDVIFAGSDKKSRTSSAQVSLKLNNDDNKLEIGYSEAELTRQLFRSGESDYLINGQKSRLQDIHYLLAKAHIGQRSYTVIGQGMIGTVLNATPLERKEFFDEAAGIKQFQIKKDQAVNKLTRARENLDHGTVQLAEITPRLKSLERQMKRLAQREAVARELDEKLNTYYAWLWQTITKNLQEQFDARIAATEKKKKQEKKLATLQDEMKQLATESKDDSFATIEKEYAGLMSRKSELAQETASWQARRDNEWAKYGQATHAVHQQRLDQVKIDIVNAKLELTNTYKEITRLKEQEDALTKEYKKIINQIKTLHDKLFTSLQPSNGTLIDTITRVHKSITQHVAELEKVLREGATHNDPITKIHVHCDTTISSIRQALQELPIESQTKNADDWQEKLKQLEQEKRKLDVRLLDTKSDTKLANNKATTLQEAIGKFEQEQQKLQTELKTSTADNAKQATKNIQERIDQLQRQAQEVTEQLQKIEEQRAIVNKSENSTKQRLFELQQQALEIQNTLNTTNQHITKCEVELARWQTKKEELEHQANQDFAERFEDCTARWQQRDAIKLDEPHKFEQDIHQLKRKKELIGSIDDETKQEYEEIAERHTFLEQQTTDLTQAIHSLHDVISDLNKKIEQQFSENIKRINEKFSHYFKMLFNGGKAELKILQAETTKPKEVDEAGDEHTEDEALITPDKAIAGVDIVATPPGKKLQSIAMLSGGEKALTSIALICAIIANNNSPFVVLDEVDAALDEANSARFAAILEELSHKTQFIVITHNRATMEKAQLLYGVTMGDDGVSKLLSIKLEEGRQYANR